MRKLFCVLIVAMMLFSVVSCNKQKSKFSDNVKIQFDENLTVEDIEKKLEKEGYVNARDKWSGDGEEGEIFVEGQSVSRGESSVGHAGDYWIPDIDLFELESGTYDILVYRVFFEEYDGILDRIIFREIPTQITVEKEYSSYVGYPEHHVVLDWNIKIEGVFSFSIKMSSFDDYYIVKNDGEKIPLEFK